eukprot:scaffold151888_cov31-Tisochrysis_lutea.AAC.2
MTEKILATVVWLDEAEALVTPAAGDSRQLPASTGRVALRPSRRAARARAAAVTAVRSIPLVLTVVAAAVIILVGAHCRRN